MRNENALMLKTEIYDLFHCVADKCPMTCCTGWSIRVEQENMDLWKSNPDTAYLCEHTVLRQKEDEISHSMRLNEQKSCVLLDSCGLCEIVNKHGDMYLSKTCAEFPRKCNPVMNIADEEEKELLMEYSLSGACPEVVRLIFVYEGKSIVTVPDSCREHQSYPMEYRIRNMLLTLLQNTEYELSEKIELCYSFLHECLECEWEEDVDRCIEVYAEKENLEEFVTLFNHVKCNGKEAFVELCQTFYDITEYYRLEPMYQPYLSSICSFVESMDESGNFEAFSLEEMVEKWNAYKQSFRFYNEKLILVICAEIFSDCISDDLEVMIETFQSIVMEYVMIRVSLFFKLVISELQDFEDRIRSTDFEDELLMYVSLFIRMIGHNVDGMAEYWENNFEDPVLDLDYLYLLLQ